MAPKKSFFLLFFFYAAFAVAGQNTHLKIYKTSSLAVEFGLEKNFPQIDTLAFDGRQYLRLGFEDETGVIFREGREIPKIVTNLAVPARAQNLTLTMLSANWQAISMNLPLFPALVVQRDENLTKYRLAADTLGGTTWPEIARIEQIGWFRNLRIAQIQIIPLRKKANGFEILKSAHFRLTWSSNESEKTRPQSFFPTNESQEILSLYQKSALNKDQIRSFLRLPKRAKAQNRSRLPGSQYLKMMINQSGIYKVDGKTLQANGVNLADLKPNQIRVFNNGGRPLPESLSASRPDSLIEIPILVEDGGDGRFDASDAIYFWGQSVNDWEFSKLTKMWQHYTNPYTTENVYWLSWAETAQPAKRFSPVAIGGTGEISQTRALRLQKVENDLNNLIRSGRNWYGRELSATDNTARYTFTLKNPKENGKATLYLKLVAKTTGHHTVKVSLNNQPLGSIAWFGRSIYEGYLYLAESQKAFEITQGLQPGDNEVELKYSSSAAFGSIRVDWLEFVAEDELVADANMLSFATAPDSQTVNFKLQGFEAPPLLFEVSQPLSPRLLTVERQGNDIVFTDTLSQMNPHRYFAASQFLTPIRFEPYTFSDLRSTENRADLIIISPREFWDQAQQLANHKRDFRGLATKVVDIDNIINEFGWGLVDPTAIRDFVAYVYRNWAIQPHYLILFGDGSYDYRNIENKNNINWIPTYQTTHASELDNRNIEAYYTYVSGDDRIMDLAIGRLPVQTAQEAQNVVDKIIAYESEPDYGFWHTLVTMVADDELVRGGVGNETFHVIDADNIAEQYIPEYLNLRKIYLMEYRAIRNASISGVRKPDAQRDLVNQINEGTLIVNYVGHGNPQQWAHEVVFMQSEDFPKIDNGYRLAFFVAATCDFGRFDMPSAQSFAEDLLNARERGVIGLLTSSRAVYASQNATFNKQYYRQLFGKDLTTQPVGDALMLARLFTNNITNDEKYTILGDPTLKLAIPSRWARVSTILPDSLFALQKTTVAGDTRDPKNRLLTDNGQIQIRVFDDPRPTTYITEAGSKVHYTLPGNLLFRGLGSIQNGNFNLEFIVPKDITYGGHNARVSLYGFGNQWEAVGYQENIPISLRSNIVFDNIGPKIEIAFENRDYFISGDPIPQRAKLIATVIDSTSGINVTGEIGHKITLILDDDIQKQLDLTAKFVYFPNSYLGGQLVAELPELSLGRHSADLKAWDNSNNSSRVYFEFVVTDTDVLYLTEVMNYPNPFRNNTSFTFFLNKEAEINISIYTIGGRLIRKLNGFQGRPGFNQVPWDGQDEDGDALANGIYLYRIRAYSQLDGKSQNTDFIGKLAIEK